MFSLALVLMIFLSTGSLASNKDISINIDGVKLHTEIAPKLVNGGTLVPIRAILKSMGAQVE